MTPERQERVLKLREKQVAHDHLMTELQNCGPDERREIIGQILGIKLKPRETKTVEEQIFEEALQTDPEYREAVKQAKLAAMRSEVAADPSAEVDERITQAALTRLETDPELMGRAVERRIERMVSGGRHHPGAMSELVDQIEALDALKERFGDGDKGKGILGGLITPETINTVLQMLPSLLGSRSGPGERVYVVQMPNGTIQEMNAQSYKAFLETEQRGKLPQPFPPAQSIASPSMPPAPSLKLSMWLPYLEKDPTEFVEALKEQSQKQDEDGNGAKFTLSVLQANTLESLMALLSPFKNKGGDVQKAIEGLEANPDWLESVLVIVKGENAGV